ncbi:MAG TPA: hypothetical protein VHW01_26985 [Polyangiaceae bacterium]|nr:hypothetical protein [Polyangiaceae bacterium]
MTDHTAALIAALSGAVDDIVLQVESILGDAIFSKVLGQEDLERARRIVELNMASIQEGARPDLDAEVVPLPAARIFASNWAAFYHTEVLDTCDREEAMRHHGERLLNSLDAAEARRSRCA